MNEETIFTEALTKPSPRECHDFLDNACGGDAEVRQRVEILLAAHAKAGTFLELPPTVLAASRDAADSLRERPGTMVGPYKLLEQIGEGGMGVVFMAEQVHPIRRRVALKIIKPGMDTKQVLARFDAERQALAMMDHSSIAKVLEAGATDAGRPYFVMELVRGIPITEYCDQHRLSPRQRLELFIQVCQAVQHAHQKGIIHRDLKPNNVLVTLADDGKPVPKVIDFGIAKATAGQRLTDLTLFTEFHQLVGTPPYMSPEQAEMSTVQDVDTRSDVYCLGVLLYELLTGSTPFDKQRLGKAAHDEIRRIIREEEPPRPSTRISTLGETLTSVSAQRKTDPRKLSAIVRGELDWIVMRALEKDRGRRYPTASDFAHDVERFLADQPVEACPPSRLYWVRKFAGRHKAIITAASIFTTVLTAATVISTWQAARATRAELSALAQKTRADDQTIITKRQAEAAQQQLKRADAFNEVMRSILSNMHPTLGSTRDLRVADLLSLAAREAESRFKFQPEAEIESRTILAGAYRGLDATKARENLRRAYELSRDLPGGEKSDRTLQLAAELARYGDVEFAQKTYDDVVQRFGEWDPTAQTAARSLATTLLVGAPDEFHRPDRIARAQQILERLLNHVSQLPPSERSHAAYVNSRELAYLFSKAHKYADEEVVARAALDRVSSDPEAGVTPRAILGFDLVDALIGQGKLLKAAGLAAETFEYDLANFGRFHPITSELLQVYSRLLCRMGRAADADKLLGENLQLARAVYPGDDDAKLDRIAYLGHLRLDLENREDALPLLIEAAKMEARLLSDSDVKARLFAREALMVASGAMRQRADGTIKTQIFCALEDLWRDDPAQTPDPQDLTPSDVRYSLIRWKSPAGEVVATGTLAEPSPQHEPEPGLYLLALEVSTKGGGVTRQAMWLSIAPWKVSFNARDEIDTSLASEVPTVTSDKILAQSQVPALAIVNGLKDIPEKTATYLTLSARASLELPAGRYRISTTSVDGVRLYVNGRTAINAWSNHRPRRDFCDLYLDAGNQDLRVEYFQAGRRVMLWVRIEPLSPASAAFATSHGGHPLRTLQRAIEEQEESRNALASATKGALFAAAGSFGQAAADYAAAIEMDPDEPLWRRQSALLCLELNDWDGYRHWRDRMVGRFSNDHIMAARTAIVALLGPNNSREDEAIGTLLKNADPDAVRPSEKAVCELAQGISDYRAGRYGRAIVILGEASAGRLTEEAKSTAELFRAMALHQHGSAQQASEAWMAALTAIAASPTAKEVELDATEIEDRLICQLAAREAQTVFASPVDSHRATPAAHSTTGE